MINLNKAILIDPSYEAFNDGQLFNEDNPILNRDDQLRPFRRLKEQLEKKGLSVHTADRLFQPEHRDEPAEYFSFGINRLDQLTRRPQIKLRGFAIMEPTVVAPQLYQDLASLTKHFDRVYIHNTHGDGYSMTGVDRSKLKKLFVPQPYREVIPQYWERRDRLPKLVVINSNKKPRHRKNELYSKRIEAVVALSKDNLVDLYGHGWDSPIIKLGRIRRSLYPPSFLHHRKLKSVYRGKCESKYETLSRYKFCLCFENMKMDGYITEKIFDCLYAGTIPIYLGASDIDQYVDRECFIDMRDFADIKDLVDYLQGLDERKIEAMRTAGRQYLQSERFLPFYDSLVNMVTEA